MGWRLKAAGGRIFRMLRTKLTKASRRSLAFTGAVFSAGILIILGALLWSFLDRHDFFSESRRRERCLRQLASAAAGKQAYAEFHGLTNGATVAAADMVEFVEGGWTSLRCPAGGDYAVGGAGEPVACPNHAPHGWQGGRHEGTN